MSIGVLGGSFDPIHNGHLAIAQYVYEVLGLDEVRFMPCGQHSFAKPLQASTQQRLEMLTLVLADKPHFRVDRRELDRTGPSYTIDSLRDLREEIGDRTPLCFILGMDVLPSLPQWRDWQQLLAYCHLVITKRPNYTAALSPELAAYVTLHQAQNKHALQNTPAGKLLFVSNKLHTGSSTQIRDNTAQVRQLSLPDELHDYISKQQLY